MYIYFGDHTCGPMSWGRKKQTAASHRGTEAEVRSLDTVPRMEALRALELVGYSD